MEPLNSTQVPHVILRQWIRVLSGPAFKCLTIITDATLGWVADKATGRRKERDWISQTQLMTRTGIKSRKTIGKAMSELLDKHKVVEAYSFEEEPLNTPMKRKDHGSRIYYRLNLSKKPVHNMGKV